MFNFDIFSKLLALNIGVSQRANAEAFALMDSIAPLTLKRYRSGREHNGWIVPHDWVVRKALIKKDGAVLFDGTAHPMAVAGYSRSFRGTLTKEELDRHVFSKPQFPDAYVFHCAYNYRPWKEHWGFCVPHNVCKDWGSGEYEVDLEVEFADGEMLVGELKHQGELDDTIFFNAHTCHPCQANDDMAGVMIILELFRWLKGRKTRYSYRGILAPEHLGTVFYLSDLPEDELSRLKAGCFLEMLGSRTPLALQQSFHGDTIMDRVAEYILKGVDPDLTVGAFRTIIGNDETVWEAPGIEIPTISISRWPYDEYHTSNDNLEIMSTVKMEEALTAVQEMIMIFESDVTVRRKFKGLVSLANPRYNLYVEMPDPVIKKELTPTELKFGRIQDQLPRYYNDQRTAFELSEIFDIPYPYMRDFLSRAESKNLVALTPVASIDRYERRPVQKA